LGPAIDNLRQTHIRPQKAKDCVGDVPEKGDRLPMKPFATLQPNATAHPAGHTWYCFRLPERVPLQEVEQTLQLALIVLEGLFSPALIRIDAHCHVDPQDRAIVVDGSNDVGSALVRVFTALLIREFGGNAFEVHRLPPPSRDVQADADRHPQGSVA
jgi:hypothetical protein